MAIIRVEGLLIETVIGVYDWERDLPQQLLVTLDLKTDIQEAVQEDAIEKAVDYDKLTRKITEWAETQTFTLVETMAVGILRFVMNHPRVTHGVVSVAKPGALKDAEYIEVEVNSDDDL